MMSKKGFILLMAAMLSAGCAREIVETEPQDNTPVIHISVGSDYLTKSSLTSTGASQHIEHMYVYMFADSGNGLECFHAADMGWTPVEGVAPADFIYKLNKAGLDAMEDAEITYLVVAVDNNSDTYSFPGTGADSDHLGNVEGMSFDDVCATVAETAAGQMGTTGTAEDKAYAMAHTELYSGVVTARASDKLVEMTIDRCVAGVLCYLTDIPYLVQNAEDESKIQRIELRLKSGLDLNTKISIDSEVSEGSVALVMDEENDDVKGRVLASADLSSYTETQGDEGERGTLLYVPPMTDIDNSGVTTLENSVLFGAYLVPVQVSGDESFAPEDATLSIVLIGGGVNGSREYTRVYPVRNTAEDHTAGNEHQVSVDGRDFNYSLQANRLYAIGSKPSSDTTEGDKPASLSGSKLELSVEPWDTPLGDIDVEFPTFSLTASFVSDFEGQILDCIGDTLTVSVLPAAGGGQWEITPDLDENFQNAIRYRVKRQTGVDIQDGKEVPVYEVLQDWTAETYRSPAVIDEVVTLDIIITDYVRMNEATGSTEDKIAVWENDYRTANLRLRTIAAGTEDVLQIDQYNAITVKVAGSDEYRGFARYDVMLNAFDRKVEEENGDGYMSDIRDFSYTGWGFSGYNPFEYMGHNESDYDGETNSNQTYEYCSPNTNRYTNYLGSALYRGRRGWTYFKDASSGDYSQRCWYTPARYEMEGFFTEVVNPLYMHFMPFDGDYNNNYDGNIIPVVNMKYGRMYWSSSSSTNWEYESWAFGVPDDVDGAATRRTSNNDQEIRLYIRQARKFE